MNQLAEQTETDYGLGDRVTYGAKHSIAERSLGDPVHRPLRVFTLDPDTPGDEGAVAAINVPYEPLKPGPVGARFKVEPNSGGDSPFAVSGGSRQAFNLEDPRVLIQSGRNPSSSDPDFHCQMVYAVSASTYAVFRTALGREVPWAFPEALLTLRPHALSSNQAFYSRDSKAIEFGWFKTDGASGCMPPDSLVFTCLSHDIIAHEVTHALLDGLRAQFSWNGNPDVPAFHEGFADLVPLLQRLSYKQVARTALQQCKGNLASSALLHYLGRQVAKGRGCGNTVRNIDLGGPPQLYDSNETAPHTLGAVMVSAVLDALTEIFRRKSEPLLRLAVGFAPGRQFSSDLLDILSHSASRLANHFLNICVRALDYCPPVDIELGEYLRALITADTDLVPEDPWGYRDALIRAFAKRRIFPPKITSMTEDALIWHGPDKPLTIRGLSFRELKFAGDPGRPANPSELERQARAHGVCVAANVEEFGCVKPGGEFGRPLIESVRSSRRAGPDGQIVFDLVAEVVQKRKVAGGNGLPSADFFGGATVILGPAAEIRYIIRKRSDDQERLARYHKRRLSDFTIVHPFCGTAGHIAAYGGVNGER